jgi:pimeloyl-ACP methyl ester carboxylesterase
LPRRVAPDAPVLTVVHGLSRTRNTQAEAFVAACEDRGVVLLAPSFIGPAHADYQRLGREGRGRRADLFLHACLQEVTRLTGADTTHIGLFGFSGGAQFAHRYLMAHPHRVAAAAIAAAGWYTFPDVTEKFPYGIRSTRRLPGLSFNPEEYLRVPVTVIVGEHDTATENLRNSERVVLQQGVTRVERARRWVAAMQAQAHTHGLASHIELRVLPGLAHGFASLCKEGALVAQVMDNLFGQPVQTEAGIVAPVDGRSTEETAAEGACA